MARYKLVDRSPRFLPVVLDEQIQPGTFEFTLDHLVDYELDLSALDAKFKNDEVGASAYDPRVMLKIVLLAYSRGLISSRSIQRACQQNVVFIAISGDTAPAYTSIAAFVRELGSQIKPLFHQVLMTCDQMGLIGKQMFAIDGVKLPSNASKERSGTHGELLHRARRLDKAVDRMMQAHRDQDQATQEPDVQAKRQAQIRKIAQEAARMREFVASTAQRTNAKGQPLKGNVTDNDSAKMATSKGVIQGYAAQAAVDSQSQVIVAADVIGSGSEQAMLLPMVEQARAVGTDQTLITADAGYHSHANVKALHDQGTPALIADNRMRKRDERLSDQGKHKANAAALHDKSRASQDKPIKLFRPSDFTYDASTNRCICPAGKPMYSNGSQCTTNGRLHRKFTGTQANCGACPLRVKCLRHPEKTKVRQVAIFAKNQPSPHRATQLMKEAIDSQRGRRLYSQRMGTVEPVFGNIRNNKRLNRFTVRSKTKVNTQWHLYCLVHNIEKMAGC